MPNTLKIGRIGFMFSAVLCLLSAQALMAQEKPNGNLVSVKWLQKNLGKSDLILLDASSTRAYNTAHIPGAINADFYSYGRLEPAVADVEKKFQSWGVSRGKKIVLYDQGGSNVATRVFFDLYYHGYPAKDLFILDGGLSKWQKDSALVTTDATPAPKKGSFKVGKLKRDARVELPQVLADGGNTESCALVEALGPNWHFGELAPFDRAGHIPNGILLPGEDFYNADKTFKSPEEIRRMLKYAGVRRDQKVYTYCGGGVAATVPWFVMQFILDYPDVRLYRESERGWLKDERGLPMWTYDNPNLLKESRGMQAGTNQMMRMFGVVEMSMIDVRPATDYNEGHIAYSVNIPAEVFTSNMKNPAKLAEILGAAGVDGSIEAVVISGGGLTRESALAFLMLENLGQKKISVLTDSASRWAQGGVVVKKEPTVVGQKKTPQDLSISPTTYPANFRKDVIISDPKSTTGLYPKVFIASGKGMPAKTPQDTVVHVPYTDLLNADGTPKAAKDIWNILVKAGVPRYAELVCFSDDTGEAAANYFILKLMGYPDVKILTM